MIFFLESLGCWMGPGEEDFIKEQRIALCLDAVARLSQEEKTIVWDHYVTRLDVAQVGLIGGWAL